MANSYPLGTKKHLESFPRKTGDGISIRVVELVQAGMVGGITFASRYLVERR